MPWLEKTTFTIPVEFTHPTPGQVRIKTEPYVHWISSTTLVVIWGMVGDGDDIPHRLYAWPGTVNAEGALNLSAPDSIIEVATLEHNEYLSEVLALAGGGYAVKTLFTSES